MIKKIKKFFFLSCLYFSILILTYWLHVSYLNIDVLLYSTIQDVLISLLIFITLNYLYKSKVLLSKFELFLTLIIFLLFGYIFAISLPTIIDRSLSFYLLEKIEQNDGLKFSEVKSVIKDEYIDELKVSEMRITEQVKSGTIQINNNCIRLTKFGKNITKFSYFFRKNFLPKNRLIGESYSSELISRREIKSRNSCN
jgi:hypothetical protein